jgi:hypothetical protein
MEFEPVSPEEKAIMFVRRGPIKALRDFTGRHGRLQAVEFLGVRRNRKGHVAETIWRVECDCGVRRTMSSGSLAEAASCGCIRKERFAAKLFKHGACATRTYSSWKAMIARCTNPKNSMFYLYGGRGVTVCQRWRESFSAFIEDMGERPAGKTLDRKDSNLGYEPGNCEWSTPREQQLNRRNTIMLTFNGKTQPLSIWADDLGVKWQVVYHRVARGWPLERALTAPLFYKRRKTAAA